MEMLDCYTKESAFYESESSGEPVKGFVEVTLSTFFIQKKHSGCTAETGLAEVQTKSPSG